MCRGGTRWRRSFFLLFHHGQSGGPTNGSSVGFHDPSLVSLLFTPDAPALDRFRAAVSAGSLSLTHPVVVQLFEPRRGSTTGRDNCKVPAFFAPRTHLSPGTRGPYHDGRHRPRPHSLSSLLLLLCGPFTVPVSCVSCTITTERTPLLFLRCWYCESDYLQWRRPNTTGGAVYWSCDRPSY